MIGNLLSLPASSSHITICAAAKLNRNYNYIWLFGAGVVSHKMQDMSVTVHVSITLSWCMYVILGTIRRELNIRVAMVCEMTANIAKS